MSDAVLSRLVASEEALIRALDTGGCADLDAAAEQLARDTAALRQVSGWRVTPPMRSQIGRALMLLDAARVRVNYLADRTRRRLDLLQPGDRPAPSRWA